MLENHKDLFNAFKVIHDNYALDAKKYQEQLNELGDEVLKIIRRYENMLCATSEGGKYSKFSNKTADKFWEYIRAYLPKIDSIGLRSV